MNPDKQEILYKEVIDKIPENGRITDAAVQQMPYLRACIKESARYLLCLTIYPKIISSHYLNVRYVSCRKLRGKQDANVVDRNLAQDRKTCFIKLSFLTFVYYFLVKSVPHSLIMVIGFFASFKVGCK